MQTLSFLGLQVDVVDELSAVLNSRRLVKIKKAFDHLTIECSDVVFGPSTFWQFNIVGGRDRLPAGGRCFAAEFREGGVASQQDYIPDTVAYKSSDVAA